MSSEPNHKEAFGKIALVACCVSLVAIVGIWVTIHVQWPFPLITLIQKLGFSADPLDWDPVAILVDFGALLATITAWLLLANVLYVGFRKISKVSKTFDKNSSLPIDR